jgi:hypothetical protein
MLQEHAPEIGRLVTGAAAIEQAQPDSLLEFLDAAAQPAPEGEFSLYIRAYWADPSIINGTWTPPNVVRSN